MSYFILDMGHSTTTLEAKESTKEILEQMESRKIVSLTVGSETRHYAVGRIVVVGDDGSTAAKEASK